MFCTCSSSSFSVPMAVMLRGTFCRLSVRFSAVTMTSSRVPPELGAAELGDWAGGADMHARMAETSRSAVTRGELHDAFVFLRSFCALRRSFLNRLRVI